MISTSNQTDQLKRLSFFIAILSFCSPARGDGPMLRVIAQRAEIQTGGPGANRIIAYVPKGTPLYAIETKGEFHQVIEPDSRRKGWVWTKHVEEVLYLTKLINRKDEWLRQSTERTMAGDYDAAISLNNEALQLAIQMNKYEEPELGTLYETMGSLHSRQGKYREAKKFHRIAIRIKTRWYGNEHQETLGSLKSLALAHLKSAEYDDAEAVLSDALTVSLRVHGSEAEVTGDLLSELGFLASERGQHREAEGYFVRAIHALESSLGRKHRMTANSVNNLAFQLEKQGKYEECVPLYKEAIANTEEARSKTHPDLVYLILNLARVNELTGQYSLAKESYERALKICENSLGERHEFTAMSLGHLATFAKVSDTYTSQETLGFRTRALKIRESMLGPTHPDTATSWNHISTHHYYRSEFSEAIGPAKKCLDARRKSLGGDHRSTIAAHYYLGKIQYEMGDYIQAEATLNEAIGKAKIVRGEDDYLVGAYCVRLANLYLILNNEAKARHHYETASRNLLESNRQMTLGYAADLLSCGQLGLRLTEFSSARRLIERHNAFHFRIDPNSAAATEGFNALSVLAVLEGQSGQAVKLQDQAQRTMKLNLSRRLPVLSYEERNRYLSTKQDIIHNALSIALQSSDDQRLAIKSAEWLINSKGASQEALTKLEAFSSPQAAPLVDEVRATRERLSKLLIASGEQIDEETKSRITVLKNKQEKLQKQVAGLGLQTAKRDSWVDTGSVRRKIPKRSVLIDIAKVKLRNFSNLNEKDRYTGEVYAAWVIPSAGEGDVKIISLGDAGEIDQLVNGLRDDFSAQLLGRLSNVGEAQLEREYREHVAELSKVLLSPIEDSLTQADSLMISPDGDLWTLSWEAMTLSDGWYVIQRFSVRYLLSGRELVQQQPERVVGGSNAIFADPDYDLVSSRIQKHSSRNWNKLRSLTGSRFERLPQTATEAAMIKPHIEKLTGQSSTVFLQADAQEAAFKSLTRPSVLVVSTHGYFESLPESGSPAGSKDRNPLLRCALAFAGCNHRGVGKSQGTQDGLLTGLEIVGTDLRGTGLVVLSACETGLGDIQAGQGVVGLRQAFQLAGAQSVVSSLWQVDDGETARLMNDFFANLAGGTSKSQALRQAQLTRMKARRERHGAAHPFFWAAFTLTGQD